MTNIENRNILNVSELLKAFRIVSSVGSLCSEHSEAQAFARSLRVCLQSLNGNVLRPRRGTKP